MIASVEPAPRRGVTALVLVTATLAALALTGYRCFRSDHITQVPMLWRSIDPALFARDWFLSGPAHYSTRAIFFRLEHLLMTVMTLELALFVQFLVYLFAYVSAMWITCRRLGRGPAVFALWVLFAAAAREFGSLAAVDVLEDLTIPRMYSYAASMWAIPLLLGGHHLAAGLVLGLAGLIHAAPSIQFLLVAAAWLLAMRGPRGGLRGAGVMAAAFAICYWPQAILLSDVISSHLYSPQEVIRWLALVRHPHHMLPSEFSGRDYAQMLSLLAFAAALAHSRRADAGDRAMLRLAGVLTVYVAISCVFIEVIPVATWIAFQPLRMFAIFRMPLFFLVAGHVVQLLRSGRRGDLARGVLTALAALNVDNEKGAILTGYLLIEALLVASARWLGEQAHGRLCGAATLLSVGLWWPHGRSRTVMAGALAVLLTLFPQARLPVQAGWRRLWRSPLAAAVILAADVAFAGALLLWPFTKWNQDPRQWSGLDERHYKFAVRFQVHPFPNEDLELAAVWARDHTPDDALFLIPPERAQESWHIWSRRAAVFNVKMFPFVQSEWAGWIERYYAMGGVLPGSASEEQIERLRSDPGGFIVGDLYDALAPEVLLAVARRYGATHIVSVNAELDAHPEIRAAAGPFRDIRERRRGSQRRAGLMIYEVLPAGVSPDSP